MTENELKNLFKRPSTIDEKAEAIISYLSSKGITPDQMLDIIQLIKTKLKNYEKNS